MIDESQARQMIGRALRSRDGSRIGRIGQVYLDDVTGEPQWLTVKTGLFGTNESFVPLAGASLSGPDVLVPYTQNQIRNAPNIEHSGHLDAAEEEELYDHYQLAYDTRDTGYDSSTPRPDEAMTRSEERLNVSTERVETGRARLRKWVETEYVQVEVPIRREKAVLVTEEITGDDRTGTQISEGEDEIILSEERPVVSTETVPRERVRLEKHVEESIVQAHGEVRKERIDVDGDVDDRR